MNQTPLLLIDEALAALASASEALNLAKQQLAGLEGIPQEEKGPALRKPSEITFQERLQIAQLIAEGNHTQAEIGALFNTHQSTISTIKREFSELPGAAKLPQFSPGSRAKQPSLIQE